MLGILDVVFANGTVCLARKFVRCATKGVRYPIFFRVCGFWECLEVGTWLWSGVDCTGGPRHVSVHSSIQSWRNPLEQAFHFQQRWKISWLVGCFQRMLARRRWRCDGGFPKENALLEHLQKQWLALFCPGRRVGGTKMANEQEKKGYKVEQQNRRRRRRK